MKNKLNKKKENKNEEDVPRDDGRRSSHDFTLEAHHGTLLGGGVLWPDHKSWHGLSAV